MASRLAETNRRTVHRPADRPRPGLLFEEALACRTQHMSQNDDRFAGEASEAG
jgi:hypothetical protein